MKPTILKPISPERQRSRNWHVCINGAQVPDVSFLTIDHKVIGTLSYGDTPAGYDGWAFHEAGGGGAVTMPFTAIDDVLWVGLVQQHRHNQGGDVWNVPRGFLDSGESHQNAASRELAEETGYLVDAGTVFRLPGVGANPNSTFFETWGDGEGVGFFALEVSPDNLMCKEGNLVFRTEHLDSSEHNRSNRTAEMIWRSRFFRWEEAVFMGDMFSNAAVARLLGWMRSRNRGF